jgi:hypothetical protein
VRLEDLEGLTTLRIDDLRARLRDHDILTVLPATGQGPVRDYVLAATPHGLAIATQRLHRSRDGRTPIVRCVPWTLVRLGAAGLDERLAEGRFDLVVRVGRRSYRAFLEGPPGRLALRDFVIVVQRALELHAVEARSGTGLTGP